MDVHFVTSQQDSSHDLLCLEWVSCVCININLNTIVSIFYWLHSNSFKILRKVREKAHFYPHVSNWVIFFFIWYDWWIFYCHKSVFYESCFFVLFFKMKVQLNSIWQLFHFFQKWHKILASNSYVFRKKIFIHKWLNVFWKMKMLSTRHM